MVEPTQVPPNRGGHQPSLQSKKNYYQKDEQVGPPQCLHIWILTPQDLRDPCPTLTLIMEASDNWRPAFVHRH